MANKASIYSNCNPQLVKLFETAGHPAKVLCVAVDYAKRQHTALLCNGRGDLLRKPFAVDNSPAGAEQLLAEVRRCAQQRRIDPQHVFFGGEDCPSYTENFLRRVRQANYLVVRVNAWEAKQQRNNFQASTDQLDVLGIAKCCLNRRGQSLQDWPEAYANLRIATRERNQLVRLCTMTTNRIHTYVDRLFPGFLDPERSGLVPFSAASVELLSERLSPAQLSRRPVRALAQWLKHRGVEEPQRVATQLKALAKAVLGPAPEQTLVLQRSLAQQVQLYRALQGSIELLDRELGYWLARTPGALLTSIGGIGVTLAAGWMAELGPPQQWGALRQLCSYGGVVPRTEQTGGPDQDPVSAPVQARCNKRFKNVLLQAVDKVRQFGSEDLLQAAEHLQAQHSHVEFALAKRLIRIAKYLALTGTLYRPRALLAPDTPKATLVAYYLSAWKKLLPKWKDKAQLQDVFAPKHPLGQWRKMAQELYGLELRLPQQRAATQPASPSTP